MGSISDFGCVQAIDYPVWNVCWVVGAGFGFAMRLAVACGHDLWRFDIAIVIGTGDIGGW